MIKHFFVSEADYVIAHLFKRLFPDFIICLLPWFRVVSAINFYHKSFMTRDKVHDVIPNDMLTQKLYSQSVSSQIFP